MGVLLPTRDAFLSTNRTRKLWFLIYTVQSTSSMISADHIYINEEIDKVFCSKNREGYITSYIFNYFAEPSPLILYLMIISHLNPCFLSTTNLHAARIQQLAQLASRTLPIKPTNHCLFIRLVSCTSGVAVQLCGCATIVGDVSITCEAWRPWMISNISQSRVASPYKCRSSLHIRCACVMV